MKTLVERQEFSNAARLFLVERAEQKQPKAAAALAEYVNLLSIKELAKICNEQGLVYKDYIVMEGRMDDLKALRDRIIKGGKDKSAAGMAKVRGLIAREKAMRTNYASKLSKQIKSIQMNIRDRRILPKASQGSKAQLAKWHTQLKAVQAQLSVVKNPRISLAVAGVGAAGGGYAAYRKMKK
jgi:hypothetical protein